MLFNRVVIVEKIKDTCAPFHRPVLPDEECDDLHPDILTLMTQCWAEEPSERPSFYEVTKTLNIVNNGKSVLLYARLFVRYSLNIRVSIGFNLISARIDAIFV